MQSAEYTTEPALATPELRVLRAKRGEVRLRIVGEGRYCAAAWSAALTLRITGLSRGIHPITLDSATLRARVR